MIYDHQYQQLLQDVIDFGVWVENDRTGERCLTIPDYRMKYLEVPLLTIKQAFPVMAVAEMIGYLRAYTNAQDFADIGAKTWFANANGTESWLNNPNRKGDDDMGKVYGAIARDFGGLDLVQKVYNNLKQGNDDRGERITFWKPDEFSKGCLRPCMSDHQFVLLGDTLYLNSYQRSVDVGLGLVANSIQCWFLLNLFAKITGRKVGYCTHYMTHVHVYEKHLESLSDLLRREGKQIQPEFKIANWVGTLEDVTERDLHAREYFSLTGYEHCGKVELEFTK